MTHGTLTNVKTGQSLTGAWKRDMGRGLFDFHIDGTGSEGNMLHAADWEFTPDPEPLPTEPGFYTSVNPSFDGLLFRLNSQSQWYLVGVGALMDSEMRNRMPLVRLVREDGGKL